MSALGSVYLTRKSAEKIAQELKEKDLNGMLLQFAIYDKTNQYGQNIAITVSQTTEERKEKKGIDYICNGKVFWTDGKIYIAEKKEHDSPLGLPF